ICLVPVGGDGDQPRRGGNPPPMRRDCPSADSWPVPRSHRATLCAAPCCVRYSINHRRCYGVRHLAIVIRTAMTLEFKMLALSIALGLVQIVLASHAASLQRGYVWTATS